MERAREVAPGLIVSIADPELRGKTRQTLKGFRGDVCALDFHDIERPAPDMLVGSVAHILAALEASRRVGVDKPVIVHCHAGIARSAAMGLVLGMERETRRGLTEEEAMDAAFAQVERSSPQARPNILMAELGARALDLDVPIFMERVWALHAR